MLPSLGKLGFHGAPIRSILVTVGLIVLILLMFDPTKIAKLASAFQLLVFIFVSLAVIVMRENGIESCDPGYKSPLYPWMQIFGIGASFWLIIQMGWLPTFFTFALVTLRAMWYFYYVRSKVNRTGAIYHMFERLGRKRYDRLDWELRNILKEKGLCATDPFDEIVARSYVFDFQKEVTFETAVDHVGNYLADLLAAPSDEIKKNFLEETQIGATPVTKEVALPHFRYDGNPAN